jgi:hypothetical protein
MGDRTYCQLSIYDVPPDQARALLDVIEADELRTDAGYHRHPGPSVPGTQDDLTGKLVLGDPGYHHRKGDAGWMFNDDLPAELVAAAPGATWMAWEDPWDEHAGTLRVHVPGLGLFTAECDSSGRSRPNPDTILAAADDHEKLLRVLGRPWLDHVAELRQRNPGRSGHLMDVPATGPDETQG